MAEEIQKETQQGYSDREVTLVQELIKERKAHNQELEYEDFDGYELPPRTQFSMLKKPAVSIKWGKMTFNMAAIRMFEGVQHILTIVNSDKKRLAVIPCMEEESSSVEWSRLKKGEAWVNKTITSVDFLENIFNLMGWERECRYKVLGRLANSSKGIIFVFDMIDAIMFAPNQEEYVDPATGEVKKRQVKYYPDAYKNRIGRSYNDYEQYKQINLFEDFSNYEASGSPTENQEVQSLHSGTGEGSIIE